MYLDYQLQIMQSIIGIFLSFTVVDMYKYDLLIFLNNDNICFPIHTDIIYEYRYKLLHTRTTGSYSEVGYYIMIYNNNIES